MDASGALWSGTCSAGWLPAPFAKQFAEQAKGATHSFQYILSKRAGTECVAHIVQALTSMDRSMPLCCRLTRSGRTIRSRGGRWLADMVDGERIIPFVRQVLLQSADVLSGKTTQGMSAE